MVWESLHLVWARILTCNWFAPCQENKAGKKHPSKYVYMNAVFLYEMPICKRCSGICWFLDSSENKMWCEIMHIFSIYLRLFFYIKVDSGFPDWDLREGVLEATGESLGGQKGEPKGGAIRGRSLVLLCFQQGKSS